MLDGTEVYRVVDEDETGPMAEGVASGFELGSAAKEEPREDSVWEDWSAGDWIAGTGVEVAVEVARR